MCMKLLKNRVRIAQVPEMLGRSDLPSLSMLPGRSSCVETQRTQSFDVIFKHCERVWRTDSEMTFSGCTREVPRNFPTKFGGTVWGFSAMGCPDFRFKMMWSVKLQTMSYAVASRHVSRFSSFFHIGYEQWLLLAPQGTHDLQLFLFQLNLWIPCFNCSLQTNLKPATPSYTIAMLNHSLFRFAQRDTTMKHRPHPAAGKLDTSSHSIDIVRSKVLGTSQCLWLQRGSGGVHGSMSGPWLPDVDTASPHFGKRREPKENVQTWTRYLYLSFIELLIFILFSFSFSFSLSLSPDINKFAYLYTDRMRR